MPTTSAVSEFPYDFFATSSIGMKICDAFHNDNREFLNELKYQLL